MLIGSTLLAFGTSAPEMVVNFLASWEGRGDIVAGNIVGSNLVNLVFGIGGAALFMPLIFTEKNIRIDYPLGALGVLFFFIASHYFGVSFLIIGFVLLFVFAIHLWHSLRNDDFDEADEKPDLTFIRSVFYALFGLVGLLIGGKLSVDGAVDVARLLDIRETLIALTVIAVGTSAPEVITCIQAVRRGHPDIAIGNIAGSQIFNGLLVLGGSSLIARVEYDSVIFQDLGLLVGLTFFVILFAFMFRRHHRLMGGGMIFVYLVYLAWIIVRELG